MMSGTERKAIRTEYKGIVFDSKSEAVFARALDLAGQDWVYHPEPHCGHEWDFLVFPRHGIQKKQGFTCGGKYYTSNRRLWTPLAKPMLVEYKPRKPSATYIRNLVQATKNDPVESVIVWGSPWNGPTWPSRDTSYCVSPVFSSHSFYGWGNYEIELAEATGSCVYANEGCERILGITESVAQEAKDFRFDLSWVAG